MFEEKLVKKNEEPTVGQLIRYLRTKANLTYDDIAKIIGKSTFYANKIERLSVTLGVLIVNQHLDDVAKQNKGL